MTTRWIDLAAAAQMLAVSERDALLLMGKMLNSWWRPRGGGWEFNASAVEELKRVRERAHEEVAS